MENEKKAPETKFSVGGIVVTIWNNEFTKQNGTTQKMKTANLEKRYKDREGNWKTTSSFNVNELPKAILLLNKAYDYLVLKRGQSPTTKVCGLEP